MVDPVGIGLTAASEKASGFRLFSAVRSVAALTRPRRVIHYRSHSIPTDSTFKIKRNYPKRVVPFDGGPGGDRTHDLSVANAALSQLSYEPVARYNLL